MVLSFIGFTHNIADVRQKIKKEKWSGPFLPEKTGILCRTFCLKF